MCSAEGSAHVLKKFFFFFTEFDVEINYRKYGGYRIQPYFPSTVPGNAIARYCLYCHCAAARRSSSDGYSYKPSSELESSVEYFRWPRAAVHSLISFYKQKTTIFRSDWQGFLSYGHLTGRFAQTLCRGGLM